MKFRAVGVKILACALCASSAIPQQRSSPDASPAQPAAQSAQPGKKPLTNGDVVSMVKAGLAESTIVLEIEQNPSKFDTSPSALIDLKNQGVSPAIIEAMIRGADSAPSQAGHLESAQPVSAERATSVELLAEGVYYKGLNSWVKLQQIAMAGGGATHVGKMLVPGLTPQVVWTFRGAQAPVQITDQRPTFYIKQSPYMVNVPGHSERDAVIVRFEKKKDHRELQTTSGGNMLTFKAGFSKEKMPEIAVNRISETIFTITPKADLQPGEYLLTVGYSGALGYDFGIAASR